MKQFHHVIAALIAAENHTLTVEALSEALVNTTVEFYRLSTYLWEARKIGCDISVTKSGRKIVSYTLRNPEAFKNGFAATQRKNAKQSPAAPVLMIAQSLRSYCEQPRF